MVLVVVYPWPTTSSKWYRTSHTQAGPLQGLVGAVVVNVLSIALPETNIAPKNGWLEYYFPIGKAYFQGLC